MSAESKGRRDQGTLCIRRAVHRGDGFCGLFGLHRLLSFENLRIQLCFDHLIVFLRLFFFSSLDSKKLGREVMQKRQREGKVSEGGEVEEEVKQKNMD